MRDVIDHTHLAAVPAATLKTGARRQTKIVALLSRIAQ
jgi:hypothetical protein